MTIFLVFVRSEAELGTRTKQVLTALKRNSLTLNHEKCEFGQRKVKSLGHKLSGRGFEIDENKTRDVMRFAEPGNATASEAFSNTKKAIASCTTTLGYFVNEDRTILYTNAFPSALGAQENGRGKPRVI